MPSPGFAHPGSGPQFFPQSVGDVSFIVFNQADSDSFTVTDLAAVTAVPMDVESATVSEVGQTAATTNGLEALAVSDVGQVITAAQDVDALAITEIGQGIAQASGADSFSLTFEDGQISTAGPLLMDSDVVAISEYAQVTGTVVPPLPSISLSALGGARPYRLLEPSHWLSRAKPRVATSDEEIEEEELLLTMAFRDL